MNKGITVKNLYEACNKILMQHGDKAIFVVNDEEGNGSHQLWYTFLTDPKEIKEFDDLAYGEIKDSGWDYKDVVLLG